MTYPLISLDENEDERSDRVTLLSGDEERKVTAQDYGSYWYLIEWEVYEREGVKFWYEYHTRTITKELINKLYELG